MNHKVILFDLGSVIINFDMNISSAKMAALSGRPQSEVFSLFFDSEISGLHESGALSGLEFYRKIKDALTLTLSFEEFKEIWNNIFWENAPVCRLVRALHKKYRVLLLSNVGQLHYEYIDSTFPIMREFDEKIASYKVGVRKPDARIYRLAIEISGARPDQIIYIDDRKELVDAALKLGISAIWYNGIDDLVDDLVERGVKAIPAELLSHRAGASTT